MHAYIHRQADKAAREAEIAAANREFRKTIASANAKLDVSPRF